MLMIPFESACSEPFNLSLMGQIEIYIINVVYWQVLMNTRPKIDDSNETKQE